MSGRRRKVFHDARLDAIWPYRGECAFCGHIDARHRLWDVLIRYPDGAEDAASWYDQPLDGVRLLRELRPYQRKSRRKVAE